MTQKLTSFFNVHSQRVSQGLRSGRKVCAHWKTGEYSSPPCWSRLEYIRIKPRQ